jgi:hypothetical protein
MTRDTGPQMANLSHLSPGHGAYDTGPRTGTGHGYGMFVRGGFRTVAVN